MRIQRRTGRLIRGLLGGLAVLSLTAATGCYGTSASTFEQLVIELTGGTAVAGGNTLTIRLVNEASSGIDETLTLEIDGVEQSYTCSTTQHLCDFVLSKCPQSVIAISERRVDTTGYFQGGRNFNGSDEQFNFTAGEFQCGQVILYRFSADTAEAYVY